MKIRIGEKAISAALLTALAGVGAGFLNGLLGAGGGIILTLAFGALLPKDVGETEATRDRFAAAVSVMFPVSILTVFFYAKSGNVLPESDLPWLLLPAAAGGAAGAFFMDRIRASWLRTAFAVLLVVSGINMLL
ncbi:MAG: TSUP family transporter [Clostridia bacterium]|nr:TSUP family transporter [Clostridia bacterium]